MHFRLDNLLVKKDQTITNNTCNRHCANLQITKKISKTELTTTIVITKLYHFVSSLIDRTDWKTGDVYLPRRVVELRVRAFFIDLFYQPPYIFFAYKKIPTKIQRTEYLTGSRSESTGQIA